MTGPNVVIAHHADIAVAMEAALSPLDLADLIRGKSVAVKPNETWASREDTTAVTQPDTLRAVLRLLRRLNPRALVVSGGSGAGETEEVCETAGLMAVIREEGAEFFDHNRPPFEAVRLDYAPDKDVGGPQREVMVNPRILQYETVVSLAQLKLHETATVTLCLKNIAMSYPAADYYGHPRGEYRRPHKFFEDMHSFIAAMAKRFPVHLGIIAGHPAMIGTGPIGGHTVETGLVIASRDVLACDAVGARLLGFDSEGVAHIREAAILGVGEADTSKMEFPGLGLQEAVNIFSQAAYGKRINLSHA